MNLKLAPKHTVKINSTYVLWFENSNQYIVISEPLMDILDVYLESDTQLTFYNQLNQNFSVSLSEAENYYTEISNLLMSSNSSEPIINKKSKSPLIPEHGLEAFYDFGTCTVEISFGSDSLKDLIHPQWSHLSVDQLKTSSVKFNIFSHEDQLYLFKNYVYVGQYPFSDYHLLQGQFALELINELYSKTEDDWLATFHASTVCNDKEAIMIIGDSGNGKSTLSALLLANGLDVLSDDFTPLSATDKHLYRFPSGISVKEGAFEVLNSHIKIFENLTVFKNVTKRLNVKYIPPAKSFLQAIKHVPCQKIVHVKYQPNSKSILKEIDTDAILQTLIPESWLSPLPSNSKLFLEWLKSVQCYHLNYSDNDMAISTIKQLFDSE